MAKLLDTLYNRVIQGKLSLDSTDDLKVVEDAIEEAVGEAKPKFELITSLGELSFDSESSETKAQFVKSDYALPEYDLYIFTMNGSFVLTPLTQKVNNQRLALCCGSFAYDELGDSMIGRVRIIATYENVEAETSNSLKITFDEPFSDAILDGGITPTGYLFGIKL